MQEAVIQCNGVQTQVITAGRWVEEGLSPDGNKHLVLVIPGNPGLPEFYKEFISAINSKLPTETPVWTIGHAGHLQPPKDLRIAMPDDTKWDQCYGLVAQVQHKIEFIKKYVPKDAKIHIIGHSIGAWCVLNMLKDDFIAQKIVKCYLIFPTIEHMAESPNGRFFINIVQRIATLLIFFSWVFTFFPDFLQVFLIRAFGMFYGIPSRQTKAVQQLINPRSLHNTIKLAGEEMQYVRELDHDIISMHAKKIWLYYGSCDKWAPVSYYANLKSQHPNVEAELCKRGFIHSFVLKNDKEMGNIIGDLINEHISRE